PSPPPPDRRLSQRVPRVQPDSSHGRERRLSVAAVLRGSWNWSSFCLGGGFEIAVLRRVLITNVKSKPSWNRVLAGVMVLTFAKLSPPHDTNVRTRTPAPIAVEKCRPPHLAAL